LFLATLDYLNNRDDGHDNQHHQRVETAIVAAAAAGARDATRLELLVFFSPLFSSFFFR
jgi:hypothetical protein